MFELNAALNPWPLTRQNRRYLAIHNQHLPNVQAIGPMIVSRGSIDLERKHTGAFVSIARKRLDGHFAVDNSLPNDIT